LDSALTARKQEEYIKEKLKLFKCNGIIYHDAKTCPNNSNCRYGMPQRLKFETGIPALIINGDLNDLRLISDEQTKTNIEAFIEQLEELRIPDIGQLLEIDYGSRVESETKISKPTQRSVRMFWP
jgi:hypothetical protein